MCRPAAAGAPADTEATEIGLQMSPCNVSALCVYLSPSIPSPFSRFPNKEISISLDPADNNLSYLNVGDSCHVSHPEKEELRWPLPPGSLGGQLMFNPSKTGSCPCPLFQDPCSATLTLSFTFTFKVQLQVEVRLPFVFLLKGHKL